MTEKIKAVLLRNEIPDDHCLWEKALDSFKDNIEYRVVNLCDNCWLEKIEKYQFDVLLAKPGGVSSLFKQLYDERIYILNNVLKYNVYPTLDEILIYENKRYLSFWLKAKKLPHPKTFVLYNKNEVFNFINKTNYPIVGKSIIGASGSGVTIMKTKNEALEYIEKAFSKKGIAKRWGPNMNRKGVVKRGIKHLFNKNDILKKIRKYRFAKNDIQKGFVLLQEFITHNYEWRVVVIGDSYFAHKKIRRGDMASGSLIKEYDNPPLVLFDFAKTIIDKYKFTSQAIDVFENEKGGFLINEMQCIFGQSDACQMFVNGIPGRYRHINNNWVFEEGLFNNNESYNLRVEHILSLYSKQ